MTFAAKTICVGIKLAPSSYEALSRRAAMNGRSLSALAKELVLNNLGIVETPPQYTVERMFLRSIVTRMSIEQRCDYRVFLSKGFSATEAIEKVLGEGWRERA